MYTTIAANITTSPPPMRYSTHQGKFPACGSSKDDASKAGASVASGRGLCVGGAGVGGVGGVAVRGVVRVGCAVRMVGEASGAGVGLAVGVVGTTVGTVG